MKYLITYSKSGRYILGYYSSKEGGKEKTNNTNADS